MGGSPEFNGLELPTFSGKRACIARENDVRYGDGIQSHEAERCAGRGHHGHRFEPGPRAGHRDGPAQGLVRQRHPGVPGPEAE